MAAPGRPSKPDTGTADDRLMLRAALMYYRLQLTQQEIGDRLGVSRFKVGRLLDRAVRESVVKIEIVHPAARLAELESRLVERFGLRDALVVDLPVATNDDEADVLARERVARAGAQFLAGARPGGAIGVSWGRMMLELSGQLEPGWTSADEIVQLNGAMSRSSRPTRAQEIVERFAQTTGASIQMMAAPAIVGSAELRAALEADPAVGRTLEAARAAATAIFSLGVLSDDSVHIASGYLGEAELAELRAAGAVGDVLGRFLTPSGAIAVKLLNDRTVGLPLEALREKPLTVGLAAGRGRGVVALAAMRARFLNVLVTDEPNARWILDHD